MYRICKMFEIENGHMLSKHPDLCKFPHGHSRQVEVVIEAKELDQNEMVCDFKVLKQALDDFLKTYDHAICMNTDDAKFADFRRAYGERVIAFENLDPTTEVMAKLFYDKLQDRLRKFAMASSTAMYPVRATLRVVKVRVTETSSTWAEYEN